MKHIHRSTLAVAAALALMSSVSAMADDAAAPAAAPAPAAAAPAAPKGPTLSDILGNSAIDVKGYVDASYIGHNRTPTPNVQVFDIDKNSFALHQVGITISSTPKEGFGGLLNLTAGRDAGIYCSYGGCSSSSTATTAGTGGNFDVTQGYIQYAKGTWTVMAGKFVALSGVEVIDPTANTNITHNILTGKVPYTLTGLRAVNAISDTTNLTLGISNGWDQVTDMNSSKTAELGLSTSLTKDTTIAMVVYAGAESMPTPATTASTAMQPSMIPTLNGVSGNRTQEDFILTSNLTPALTFIINFDHVSQEKVFGINGSAQYWDVTAYLNYQINEKYRTSFRIEKFNDESGAATGVIGANYVNVATATVGYAPVKNFELRGEISGTQAKVGTFAASDGTFNKTLATVAIEGVYKF